MTKQEVLKTCFGYDTFRDGQEPLIDALVDGRDALGAAFGSFDRWEADFRRTGMSLAGGSGWCVLVYNLHTRSLHNHWAWDHMHGAIAGVPLLALDMYEHSFHMDYGTAAAKYVDAFFRNIDWEVVDRRYAAALRGGG